jgi:hypothetical protein
VHTVHPDLEVQAFSPNLSERSFVTRICAHAPLARRGRCCRRCKTDGRLPVQDARASLATGSKYPSRYLAEGQKSRTEGPPPAGMACQASIHQSFAVLMRVGLTRRPRPRLQRGSAECSLAPSRHDRGKYFAKNVECYSLLKTRSVIIRQKLGKKRNVNSSQDRASSELHSALWN